ncbi:MAG: hypothetical protein BGN87_00085 [Rhizobiales bacterium 65-79]|nr:hypothetical protein [Hyphomicrobiales bacterium]OJU02584.1 MAG: hypothetical protein BGN87_00085 [Rhizobiales bacterium 65-79]
MMANRALLAASNQGPAPATPANAVYAGAASASFSSSVTLTNVPIGTAADDREVFIFVGIKPGSTYRSLTGATIGGVTATIHGQTDDSTYKYNIALISAPLASGTAATVVLTFSGSGSGNVYLNIYAATGLQSTAAIDVQAKKYAAADKEVTLQTLVSAVKDGIALAAGCLQGNTTSYDLSGVTEEFSTQMDYFNPQYVMMVVGSAEIDADNPSYPVNFTSSDGTTVHFDRSLVASFR